jgi:hypothetical protein
MSSHAGSKSHSRRCRYLYITVMHRTASAADIGWGAIGYGSEKSYLADKADGYTANAHWVWRVRKAPGMRPLMESRRRSRFSFLRHLMFNDCLCDSAWLLELTGSERAQFIGLNT